MSIIGCIFAISNSSSTMKSTSFAVIVSGIPTPITILLDLFTLQFRVSFEPLQHLNKLPFDISFQFFHFIQQDITTRRPR